MSGNYQNVQEQGISGYKAVLICKSILHTYSKWLFDDFVVTKVHAYIKR